MLALEPSDVLGEQVAGIHIGARPQDTEGRGPRSTPSRRCSTGPTPHGVRPACRGSPSTSSTRRSRRWSTVASSADTVVLPSRDPAEVTATFEWSARFASLVTRAVRIAVPAAGSWKTDSGWSSRCGRLGGPLGVGVLGDPDQGCRCGCVRNEGRRAQPHDVRPDAVAVPVVRLDRDQRSRHVERRQQLCLDRGAAGHRPREHGDGQPAPADDLEQLVEHQSFRHAVHFRVCPSVPDRRCDDTTCANNGP